MIAWPDYVLRSALGAVILYNIPPDSIVRMQSARAFQARLQKLLIAYAQSSSDWEKLFSWRQPLYAHALRGLRDWN